MIRSPDLYLSLKARQRHDNFWRKVYGFMFWSCVVGLVWNIDSKYVLAWPLVMLFITIEQGAISTRMEVRAMLMATIAAAGEPMAYPDDD